MTEEIGWVKEVGQETEGQGANGTWYRQEFVIETGGQYSRTIDFSVFNKKVDLSHIKKGDKVKVTANAQSREYNGKYYTSLICYKLEIMTDEQTQTASEPAPQPQTQQSAQNPPTPPSSNGDDLPF